LLLSAFFLVVELQDRRFATRLRLTLHQLIEQGAEDDSVEDLFAESLSQM
jgi:hypothetical protein